MTAGSWENGTAHESRESDGDGLPPKNEGEIAAIPDVEPGDRVEVTTSYGNDPDRTLTVESVSDDGGTCVLEGYGTKYKLSTDKSEVWNYSRVYLTWKSRREGAPVVDIEVLDE